jgi:hypothetical protein
MVKPSISRLLFASMAAFAFACLPNPALGKHGGRSSHVGKGSSGGGSEGLFHSHGSSRSGGGGHFSGRHFKSGGHNGGSIFHRPPSAAPRQFGGGSSISSGGFASPRFGNFSRFGGRPMGSNLIPAAGSTSRSWSAPGQSFRTNSPNAAPSSYNYNPNRPPSATSPSRNWSGQAQSLRASPPRLVSSSYNPNRPPPAGSASRIWSSQGQSSWTNTHSPAHSFESHREPSTSAHSRFSNSASGPFSNSRIGSNAWLFQNSSLRSPHPFHSDETNFDRGNSFGAGDFSIVPELFGLALNLGTFGLRGLGLLGLGVQGLDLLGSASSGFGASRGFSNETGTASPYLGLASTPYSAPFPTPYSTPILTCPR